MTLSIREVILARGALKALERVGDLGLSQEALLSQAALESETHLLTSVEGQALMRVLVEKIDKPNLALRLRPGDAPLKCARRLSSGRNLDGSRSVSVQRKDLHC